MCKKCVDGWIMNEKGHAVRCPDIVLLQREKKLKEKFPEVRGDIREFTNEFQGKQELMQAAYFWLESESRHLFILHRMHGIGKTHLALHLLMKSKMSVAAFTSVEFFRGLSGCASMERENEIDFGKLKNKDQIILIDDVGTESRTPANQSQFHSFLSTYPGKLIFTSNFWVDEWGFVSAVQSRLKLSDRIVINLNDAKNMREKK